MYDFQTGPYRPRETSPHFHSPPLLYSSKSFSFPVRRARISPRFVPGEVRACKRQFAKSLPPLKNKLQASSDPSLKNAVKQSSIYKPNPPMEKKAAPSLFVNDGSFMEKFKQLQQEKQGKEATSNEPKSSELPVTKPAVMANKRPLDIKANNGTKPSPTTSGGKLAFSLKQKSKVMTPAVKLGEDDEEERGDFAYGSNDDSGKRQKLGASEVSKPSSQRVDVAPSSPSDPTVKNAADKLASFVAKNGRNFEHVTRQKNPGDTPFKFLYDSSCSEYKYYEHRLIEEEKALAQSKGSQATNATAINTTPSRSSSMSQRNRMQQHSKYQTPASSKGKRFANQVTSLITAAINTTPSRSSSMSQRNRMQQHSKYQTPASALYETSDEMRPYTDSGSSAYGESSEPSSSDRIAMMEYYMKKAAQEERKRPPKQSKDEMPPPASLQASGKKGHHMGDYIPLEELEKFMVSCNDVAAQKAAHEAAEKAKIQADNIGHKLLSKMGWREGEGLGSGKSGRADPVMAGDVKRNHLGVGASQPGEVTPDDDIYEQYKKRMMLGYRYRPNPLNNPRKSYY